MCGSRNCAHRRVAVQNGDATREPNSKLVPALEHERLPPTTLVGSITLWSEEDRLVIASRATPDVRVLSFLAPRISPYLVSLGIDLARLVPPDITLLNRLTPAYLIT
jgi:hypothetical protein